MTNKQITVKPEDIFVLYPEYDTGKNPFKKILIDEEWVFEVDTLFDALENQEVKNDEFGVREEVLSVKNTEEELKFVEKMIAYFVEKIDEQGFFETLIVKQNSLIQFSVDLSDKAFVKMYKALSSDEVFNNNKNDFVQFVVSEEMHSSYKMILEIQRRIENADE